jgi:heme a synthase
MRSDSAPADPAEEPPSAEGSAPAPGVRRWAIASIVANIAIVTTGGAVRLTRSGLGCPTWPRCTEDSFVPTGEATFHSAIEFGNRLLTFALVLVALGTLRAAWKHRPVRRDLRGLAVALALGIPAQAVVGGISVLTDLNPYVVSGHFLASMILIALAVLLLRRTTDPPDGGPVPPAVSRLATAVGVAAAVAVWLGTVVTGTGPHAGDAASPRTGLDLQLVAQIHADAVFLLLGLTCALVVVAWAVDATGAPHVAALRRSAMILLGVELGQGTVGYVQWFLGLPELLVAVHMLGASLLVAAAADVVVRSRGPAGARERQTEPTVAAPVA